MKEKKKKISKYYNPYPFLVRVLNDLKEPQLLAPQAHCKVMGGEYDQSSLELVPVDKRGERVYRGGMKIELRRLSKEDLVSLAWAVLAFMSREDLEPMSKKDLIDAIKGKTGEKSLDEEEEVPKISESSPEEEVKIEDMVEEAVQEELPNEETQDEEESVVKESPYKSKSKRKKIEIQQGE